MLTLQFTSRGLRRSIALQDGGHWLIGRRPHCEIHIDDNMISGEHAELKMDQGVLTLRRLSGAKNPIIIDGKRVESATLAPERSFSIGETAFAVCAASQAEHHRSTTARLVDSRSVLAGATAVIGDTMTSKPASRSAETPAVELIGQLATLLGEATNKGKLEERVLELACQRLNAGRALLAQVTAADQLQILKARGFPPDTALSDLISSTVLKELLQEQQAILIGDTGSSRLARQPSITSNQISAVACVPVLDGAGRMAAVLYVDNQKRPGAFTDKDAEFLIWLGHFYTLLAGAIEMRYRLAAEVTALKSAAAASDKMIAEDSETLKVIERARRMAATEANILILGESGAGKECIARFIHQQSPRNKGPLVALNCAGIPATLFESEMFGHRKGAFTGAVRDHDGAFKDARGGTLFLDEIGDMAIDMQAKVLRAIEQKTVRPVGGSENVATDVRLICATNKDLKAAVKAKEFREDLYFRIETVKLEMPPLRKRKLDILPLARQFLQHFGHGAKNFSEEAQGILMAYDWPGNVRELRSAIERAVAESAGRKEIQPEDFSLPVKSGERVDLWDAALSLSAMEKQHIARVMKRLGGNITHAATALGIARSTLVQKLKEMEYR